MERNYFLVGRMKTKADKEISLLSGLRGCGGEEKEKINAQTEIENERPMVH